MKSSVSASLRVKWLFLSVALFLSVLGVRPALEFMGVIGFFERPQVSMPLNGAPAASTITANAHTSLALRFNVTALTQTTPLLQTAPGATGIRVALTPHNGLMQLTLQANDLIITVPIWLQLQAWHDLRLDAWNGHLLTISLDGMSMTWVDPSILYVYSRLQVGSELDSPGVPTFQGKIATTTVTSIMFDPAHHKRVQQIFTISLIVSFGLILIALMNLQSAGMTKAAKVTLLASIVLVGGLVSVAFHAIAQTYYGVSYPLNSFLMNHFIFRDFIDIYNSASDLNPYRWIDSGRLYFPFAYLLVFPFTQLPLAAAIALALAISVGGLLWLNTRFLSSKSAAGGDFLPVFILTAMSYPLLFCLQRANFDGVIFLFVAIALLLYQRQRFMGSAFWLALATAMKGYPGIFCLLFLIDRRYREALWFGLVAFLLTLASLLCFDNSLLFNVGHWLGNLAYFNDYFQASDDAMRFSTSIFGVVKTSFYLLHDIAWHQHAAFEAKTFMRGYGVFAGIGLLVMLAYVYCIETIFWRKLTILVCAILLLPPISYDYRLLFLYLPLYYFVNDGCAFKREQDLKYGCLLALLLIPKNYYLIYGDVSLSSLLNVVLLVLLATSIMVSGVWAKITTARLSGVRSP